MARAVLLVTISFALHAQFGPLLNSRQAPQAASAEELDLYLEIYTAQTPRAVVDKVREFAMRYPRSEFLGFAWQDQMRAFQELNDFAGLLDAGEKALSLLPRNINTLMALASAIPNGAAGRADAPELLARAEAHARLALEELRTFQVPREIPLEEWERRRASMESELHESLGHVAAKRGDLIEAEREFRSAIVLAPQPNGRQFLRLSSVLILAKRSKEAEEVATEAVRHSSGEIRRLAEEQLASIRARGPR